MNSRDAMHGVSTVFWKNLNRTIINRLSSALDDLPLPFMFDVLDYKQSTNKALKEKIDKQGKVFFERKLNTAL